MKISSFTFLLIQVLHDSVYPHLSRRKDKEIPRKDLVSFNSQSCGHEKYVNM